MSDSEPYAKPRRDDPDGGILDGAQPPSGATLLGRLFIVPALVVCVLLAIAVVVVMFGASSIEQPGSIEDLLADIEADPGARTMNYLLLPQAKKAVQAAMELPKRIAEEAEQLDAEAVEGIAGRIVLILERDADRGEAVSSGEYGLAAGHNRAPFLISALGMLKTPAAVEPLIGALAHADEEVRKAAIISLANLRTVPGADRALRQLYEILEEGRIKETQMLACLSVASLASRGDGEAISHLGRLLEGDRELQWNAATGLSVLGSKRGKLVLMNMLDRGYWAGMELRYEEMQATVTRRFSDLEISNRLCAAIQAAAHLDDPDLKVLIEKLRAADASLPVREAARRALDRAEAAPATTGEIVGGGSGSAPTAGPRAACSPLMTLAASCQWHPVDEEA